MANVILEILEVFFDMSSDVPPFEVRVRSFASDFEF